MISATLTIVLLVFTMSSAWSQAFRGGQGAARAGWTARSPGPTSSINQRAGTRRPSLSGARVLVPHSPNVTFHRHAPSSRFIGGNWIFSFGTLPPFLYYHPNHFRFGYTANHRNVVITEIPGTISVWTSPGISDLPYQQFAPAPLLPKSVPGRSLEQLAPFNPTPQEVVDRMLMVAAVHTGDVVYDLGAGDGRVVIRAAKNYGVKAVGFEIDAGLVKLAREKVKKENLESLVEIRQQDFMTANLSATTW